MIVILFGSQLQFAIAVIILIVIRKMYSLENVAIYWVTTISAFQRVKRSFGEIVVNRMNQ